MLIISMVISNWLIVRIGPNTKVLPLVIIGFLFDFGLKCDLDMVS